ncbi:MAG TPA: FecR domain-containing protein [Gemmatimonadaceae bacterium]
MSMTSDPSDVLIARYLAGETSAAEARELEARLAQSTALRRRVDEIRHILDADLSPAKWDAERMWSEHRTRTRHASRADEARRDAPAVSTARDSFRSSGGLRQLGQTSPFARFAAAAAIVLIAAGTGAAWLATRGGAAKVAPPSEEPNSYSTRRGQYAMVQLTDGSRVTLAPESRLTIPAAFSAEVRDVVLDGEAIFDVRHDAAHPFRVHAHGARVEDIGTRFDLRAYASEPVVTVAVAEGAVALGRDRNAGKAANGRDVEGIILRRGELGSLDASGRASTTRAARVSAFLGWADGRLSFVSRPLPEVLATIGRWYNLDVRVPDTTLASRLVTAEFSTQSADEMIRALAIAMDANVERNGREVTFRAK